MDGLMLLKTICLFFLLISTSLLSTSCAGRQSRFVSNFEKEELGGTHYKEVSVGEQLHHEEMSEIHERLLKANTKDYGRYDPAPALSKPRFKLIPN
ncbi:protein CASPARIAN STRIP INTEGRITY FACTOR 1-like [Nicotiana tabacum]|uniref:Protein CASPARIAN STRIP INTEGRITY FACTOR 1-like n=1 Tax=Nicotiana tabacum TaxID=4097 RepID=A0AC58UG45_TOBAC|nr:protein CASPARIAN STRIP INTEGRITY FACTOR 1-like [Nicotiana tomentosiformis]